MMYNHLSWGFYHQHLGWFGRPNRRFNQRNYELYITFRFPQQKHDIVYTYMCIHIYTHMLHNILRCVVVVKQSIQCFPYCLYLFVRVFYMIEVGIT